MKSWRKCRITDDTAENRHCVQTDLDHGKEHAGIFLHIQNALAFILPSSASSLSLILREAASEISDIEKNALTAIKQSMTKILFNISYPTFQARSSEGEVD